MQTTKIEMAMTAVKRKTSPLINLSHWSSKVEHMGQKTHDHPYLFKTKVPKPSLYRLPNTQDITFRKRPTGNQSLQKMYQLPPEFHRFKQITRNMNSWALLSRTSRKIAMGDIWNQECQILVKNFGILISSRAGTGASTVQPNGKTTSYLIPLRDRKESRRWYNFPDSFLTLIDDEDEQVEYACGGSAAPCLKADHGWSSLIFWTRPLCSVGPCWSDVSPQVDWLLLSEVATGKPAVKITGLSSRLVRVCSIRVLPNISKRLL